MGASQAACVVFVWGACEAVFWPIMPDFILCLLCAIEPTLYPLVILPAVAGSASGGILSYFIGKNADSDKLLARLPLIRAPMVKQARLWFADEGARGVRHQALSGLPFKVFALTAGNQRLPLLKFIGWAMLVRVARFIVVASIAFLVGTLFAPAIQRFFWPLLITYTLSFWLMLLIIVRNWERRG